MKKFIVIFLASFFALSIYAAEKQTYQMCSMIEGILQLHVKDGQTVKKGQMLFNIDPAPFKIQRDGALNEVKYFKQQLEMNRKLFKTHTISPTEFETAKFNYQNALSDLKAIEIQIKECYYRAPFDGKISNVIYYTGSNVGDGSEILDITPNNQT